MVEALPLRLSAYDVVVNVQINHLTRELDFPRDVVDVDRLVRDGYRHMLPDFLHLFMPTEDLLSASRQG